MGFLFLVIIAHFGGARINRYLGIEWRVVIASVHSDFGFCHCEAKPKQSNVLVIPHVRLPRSHVVLARNDR